MNVNTFIHYCTCKQRMLWCWRLKCFVLGLRSTMADSSWCSHRPLHGEWAGLKMKLSQWVFHSALIAAGIIGYDTQNIISQISAPSLSGQILHHRRSTGSRSSKSSISSSSGSSSSSYSGRGGSINSNSSSSSNSKKSDQKPNLTFVSSSN